MTIEGMLHNTNMSRRTAGASEGCILTISQYRTCRPGVTTSLTGFSQFSLHSRNFA